VLTEKEIEQVHKQKVIIDTDMGQMNDDALSMFMLLNAENIDVLGITLVAGNTWVEEGTAFTLRQLEMIGKQDIPVFQGANEPLMGNRQNALKFEEGLYGNAEYIGAFARVKPSSYLTLEERVPYWGYPTTVPENKHAVNFIVESIKKYPNEISLFVLGPCTNVALAVKTHPEIIPLVKQVFFMGGAIDIRGNTTPAAEFNFWFDPESAKIALRCGFKEQYLVPNDIAEKVYFTKEIYQRVTENESPLSKMFKDIHGARFEVDGYKSFVWDVITIAVFLDPSMIAKEEIAYIDIDAMYGPNYGRSIAYGESRRRSFEQPANFPAGSETIKIIMDIDREKFWNIYLNLLTVHTHKSNV